MAETEVACESCGAAIGLFPDTAPAEIVSCVGCGEEYEVLETTPKVRLGAPPEIEEDWGE